jgi:hypothetical protein
MLDMGQTQQLISHNTLTAEEYHLLSKVNNVLEEHVATIFRVEE